MELGRFWWWVVLVLVQFGINGCFGCWEQERIALLQLKASIINYADHGYSKDFTSWDSANKESDCCDWERVKCNITIGRVIQLDLYDTTYDWYLNASLFLPFEELQYLDLSFNYIPGCLPNEGFERFSALSKLEVLDLDWNHFNNNILLSLSGVASLKKLNLGGNNLNGSCHIRGLTKLEELDLSSNNFNNSILSSLSGIASLKKLDLSVNKLNGSIHIQVFSNLEELYLIGNEIHDFVVTTEDSNRSSKLQVLDLRWNKFSARILASLAAFPLLKILNISHNSLEGSFTTKDFKVFSNLEELDLSSNKIHDFVVTTEDSNSLSKLQVLSLSWTNVSARILESSAAFPSLKILDLRHNNLEGSFTTKELGTLNKLEQLYLDYSSIDKSILHKVGVMTSLNLLTMRNCGLNGSLLAQDWCELRKIKEIDLNGNNIEGKLPYCMANLTSLSLLDLSDNHFNDLPHLSSLTSLGYLSLSDNDFLNPIRFSLFSNLSNLKVLLTDNNAIDFEPNTHSSIPTFQLKFLSLLNGSFNGLNRTTPRFLQYQYDLRVIDLSHNNLVGKFPNWLLENNTRLERLILNNNYFTGPFTVPYDLRPNVTFIDISDNSLQGPIPTNFGLVFPNLDYLNMSKNEFQGSIPSSFGNLISLQVLDMSKNHLSGKIPIHFTMGCYSLFFLKLSYNNFSGQIFPTNFNMTQLSSLYLDNNHFSGKIPNSISQIISFDSIDFSNNHLSGMLPTWMGNMSFLSTISMAKNQLEGPIPMELCKLVHLEFLDLSENNLSGPAFPSCFNFSRFRFVHLNKNLLSGPIPSAFQNNSDLVTLNLLDNHLTGNIPNWIGSLSSLRFLLLKANYLGGRVPIQLCLLHKLTILDLSYNKFSGPIPHCLSNITFAASTKKQFSVGFILVINLGESPWAYLKTKSTIMQDRGEHNKYARSYTSMGVKEKVEFTTKKSTYLYMGDILNDMSGIDLSCNRLEGEIPADIGRISNIRALNLSHNNLSGPIPLTFSNLKQIESLDLSSNNLNDKIPPQLTELTFLEVFNVSHNNLSGSTPDRKNQFGTFDESSYEGNPLLCGLPLHNGCTKIGPPSTMPMDHEGEENGSFMDMGVFYISFVVAYITMLLGIVAVLYINPYWRREWFNFIEACIDTCYCFVVVHCHKLPGFKLA